ncbi:MAG: zinc-dependent alcohol dehydrogenase [Arachnia sp.]
MAAGWLGGGHNRDMVSDSPAQTTSRAARALWTLGPHLCDIRPAQLPEVGRNEAEVRSVFSGVSRGTELLVLRDMVPPVVAGLMRAPFQEGDFPYPVKYGYLSVGVVENGPPSWIGKRVFCLHPHQDRYVVPVAALTPIPAEVPDGRAVLAGAVETGINALWDCPPHYGDRIAVVGAGIVGSAIAALLRQYPLQRLQLVDPDPAKEALAVGLGVEWAHPGDAMGNCDIVYHASASPEGLANGLAQLGKEGSLVELSWYGTDSPEVPLGLAFHAKRLNILGSQVGAIAASRRARRTHQDRMDLAMRALADPLFDQLLGGTSPFEELPSVLQRMDQDVLPGMLRLISYPPVS